MKWFLLLLAVYHLLLTAYASAQVGMGVRVEPGRLVEPKKTEKTIRPDAYAVEISSRFSVKAEEIAKLFTNGFGRKETIKILLISQKAGVTFSDVVKLRNKKTTFADITKKYALDYTGIRSEAEDILRNINYTLKVVPASKSTEAVATSKEDSDKKEEKR